MSVRTKQNCNVNTSTTGDGRPNRRTSKSFFPVDDYERDFFFSFLASERNRKVAAKVAASVSLFRCYDSRMCFGDGCVISLSAICRLFGSWASAKIADWSACEQNPRRIRIADRPVDDALRHCCSSPHIVPFVSIVSFDAPSKKQPATRQLRQLR